MELKQLVITSYSIHYTKLYDDHDYKVVPHLVTGWWKDTGKLEDMLEANRLILDTIEACIEGDVDEGSTIQFRVIIEKGAEIRNSVIRGPAIIGAKTVIRNAYVVV